MHVGSGSGEGEIRKLHVGQGMDSGYDVSLSIRPTPGQGKKSIDTSVRDSA